MLVHCAIIVVIKARSFVVRGCFVVARKSTNVVLRFTQLTWIARLWNHVRDRVIDDCGALSERDFLEVGVCEVFAEQSFVFELVLEVDGPLV